MTFWVNYKPKASKTIIPTWTLHIFFVIILTLHLKNWFQVILHSLTMATVCAKYEQNWAKERYTCSMTCVRARTLHIFSAMILIKFCSRSLYTLWQKALCGWRIGQIGPWGEKIWSGQELYMWFSFDFNLEPRILIQGHWTPFDKRHSLGNSNVIYDRVGGGGGVGGVCVGCGGGCLMHTIPHLF